MRRTTALGTGFVLLLAAGPVAAQLPPGLPPAGVARVVQELAGHPADPACADPCAPAACPVPCPPEPPRVPWRLRWDPCQPPPPYWVSAEYLYWHVSDGPRVGDAVATSPATTLAQLVANPAGAAAAGVGGGSFDMSSGLRVSGGHWFGPNNRFGAEVSGFGLERRDDSATVQSDAAGSPTILRPFTNAVTGLPDFALVSLPGSATGSVTVESTSRVWGVEANMLVRAVAEPDHYVTPLVGLRYLDLEENLDIVQQTTLIGRGSAGFAGRQINAPQGLVVADRFDTRSHFFGGQLGVKFGSRYNRLDVGAVAKIGLGWAHHAAGTSGSTTLTGPGGGAVAPGGLLAVPTNSVRTNADDLAVLPELGLQFGYDVAPCFRLTAGYSALWWSRVVRPGAQVVQVVNPGQVPASLQFGRPGPAAQPAPLVRDGLWINGVQFGAVVRF